MATRRYEGGLTPQDTTGASTSPLYLPHAGSYGTVDLGAVVPIRSGLMAQVGVKNLFDRNYYYTAGCPDAGRKWYLNLGYRLSAEARCIRHSLAGDLVRKAWPPSLRV